MTKRSFLLIAAVSLLNVNAWATTPGADFANDPAYDPSWTDGDDGGTPSTFVPWDLNSGTGSGGFAGFFIGDSTAGSGNINSDGQSFGMFANPSGAFADAFRDFGSPLAPGDVFSFDIAVDELTGSRGFNLLSNGSSSFNFNAGNGQYSINAVDSGFTQQADSVFSFAFTQTDTTSGTYSVSRGAESPVTGTYSGTPTGFQFYINNTGGGDANNLYFNNLAVTAIPEPSTASLLAASVIFGGCFYVRRRYR